MIYFQFENKVQVYIYRISSVFTCRGQRYPFWFNEVHFTNKDNGLLVSYIHIHILISYRLFNLNWVGGGCCSFNWFKAFFCYRVSCTLLLMEETVRKLHLGLIPEVVFLVSHIIGQRLVMDPIKNKEAYSHRSPLRAVFEDLRSNVLWSIQRSIYNIRQSQYSPFTVLVWPSPLLVCGAYTRFDLIGYDW